MSDKLVIIDISGWVFKAFFSTRNGGDPGGELTGRIRGAKRSGSHLLIAMDDRASWRRELYPPYKSQRPPRPEGVTDLFRLVNEVIARERICALSIARHEADDVIAAAAHMGAQAGLQIEIHSVDKDILALVQPNIAVMAWRRAAGGWTEIRYDVDGVIGYLGIRPQQVPDFLAVVGDTADGIPGVEGVGPVAATALLQRYGDIDGILGAEPAGRLLDKRTRNALLAIKSCPLVPIYRNLATLRRPDLGIGLDDMRIAP